MAQHGQAMRMAEGKGQALRVERAGMEVSQEIADQLAPLGRTELGMRQHADPLHAGMLAQECLDLGRRRPGIEVKQAERERLAAQ